MKKNAMGLGEEGMGYGVLGGDTIRNGGVGRSFLDWNSAGNKLNMMKAHQPEET